MNKTITLVFLTLGLFLSLGLHSAHAQDNEFGYNDDIWDYWDSNGDLDPVDLGCVNCDEEDPWWWEEGDDPWGGR